MNTDPKRNEPAEKGRNDDPNLRDESAAQPGINTVSSSNYDDDNEKLTKTAADSFRTEADHHPNADQTYDEADEE